MSFLQNAVFAVFIFLNTFISGALGLFHFSQSQAIPLVQTTATTTQAITTSAQSIATTARSMNSLNAIEPIPLTNDTDFATDTQYVYSYGNVVIGADSKTFVALNSVYEKDYRQAYYGREDIGAIPDADAQSFEVFDSSYFSSSTDINVETQYGWRQDYAKDKSYVYYSGLRIAGADPQTFELLSIYYAKDSRTVFFLNRPLATADPASFVVTQKNNGTYEAHDKYHQYFADKIVQ